MKHNVIIGFLALVFLAGCAAPTPLVSQPTPQVIIQPNSTQENLPVPTQTQPSTPTQPPSSTAKPLATAAEPTQAPAATPLSAANLFAYTGLDQNIWLYHLATGDQLQVTTDGKQDQFGGDPKETIHYCCAQWSSDGKLLAFERTKGVPVEQGMKYQFDLYVYELASGQSRVVLEDQQAAGFSWRPATHQISYALPVRNEYFVSRAELRPQYALGIWSIDVDQGSPSELVKPERGYSLVRPVWSKNGSYLSFEEVLGMEGRGQFAYYDAQSQKYISWEKVIGSYDWSPDASLIAYDFMAYVPSGTERITLNNPQGTAEKAFSPAFQQGYASSPLFSPKGDQLSYTAFLGAPDSTQFTLFVQPLPEGEPHQVGVYDQGSIQAWYPSGDRFLVTSGPYDKRQISEVLIADGSSKVLTEGTQPVLQP